MWRRFWLVQALVVTGWWLMLWLAPSTRGWFGFGTWPEGVLWAFAAPDAMVLVAGSLVAWRATGRWQPAAAWLVAGGCCYALLWCVAASLASGGGWLGSVAMALLAVGNLVAALAATGGTEAP